jgi:hypothetical protein
MPACGILSVALTPLAALFAVGATVIVERFFGSPFTESYRVARNTLLDAIIHGVVRAVVMLTFALVVAGVVSAFIALVRRERPRWLPIIGLVSTAFLFGLFHYFALPD